MWKFGLHTCPLCTLPALPSQGPSQQVLRMWHISGVTTRKAGPQATLLLRMWHFWVTCWQRHSFLHPWLVVDPFLTQRGSSLGTRQVLWESPTLLPLTSAIAPTGYPEAPICPSSIYNIFLMFRALLYPSKKDLYSEMLEHWWGDASSREAHSPQSQYEVMPINGILLLLRQSQFILQNVVFSFDSDFVRMTYF